MVFPSKRDLSLDMEAAVPFSSRLQFSERMGEQIHPGAERTLEQNVSESISYHIVRGLDSSSL